MTFHFKIMRQQLAFGQDCSLSCTYKHYVYVIANEPAERRRSAGEAAENSAARRMLYAEKFSIDR